MRPNESVMQRSIRRSSTATLLLACLLIGCVGGETTTADNGGIGGTGVSQGEIDSFGSIFVTGIEWDLAGATIELDGQPATEADLRVNMQVRVIGEIEPGGTTAVATAVTYDSSLVGPVAAPPTILVPDGSRLTLSILGRSVLVDAAEASFGPGLSIALLAEDQLLRISGYQDDLGGIRATRVDLLGTFPIEDDVELDGAVANLLRNPDGSGIFDLGPVTVRYTPATGFSGLSEGDLENGTRVDVAGVLRASGTDLDASAIEAIEDPFETTDFEDIELVGIVSGFVSNADFRLGGVAVDASTAILDPPSLTIADGMLLEVEGSLAGGVLTATRVEDEHGEGSSEIAIIGALSSIDVADRELLLLGVTIVADGLTEIEDERDEERNFGFDDLDVGDWIKVEGEQTTPGRARAKSIKRLEAGTELRLKGPVTALDAFAPSLDVVGQAIPIDGATSYFDELEQARTEEEFFRSPGDVALGTTVVVEDEAAVDATRLIEADVVSID